MADESGKFTDQLLASNPEKLSSATRHPFLKQAAEGTLPEDQLVAWLAQDRLYAISYITFIGQLLSKVDVPATSDRTNTLQWHIADCLINCLDNIRRELKLFEDTAHARGWTQHIHDPFPKLQTQAYKELFASAAQPSSSLFRGLVTLWATEHCYLQAWTYSKGLIPEGPKTDEKDVMRSVFIPNWSSDEFVAFVSVLEDIVNALAGQVSEGERRMAMQQWGQVLWAEEAFWPKVEG